MTIIIHNENEPFDYAVGVSWRRLVTAGDPAKTAREVAKTEKATHVCHVANEMYFGYAALKGKNAVSEKRTVYAMAKVMGSSFPGGTSVVAISLPGEGGKAWVCVVDDGAPQSGSDRVIAADDALELVNHLLEANPTATLYTDILVHGMAHSDVQALEFADLMERVGEESRLAPLQLSMLGKLSRQSPAVKGMIGLAVVGAIAQYGWSEYDKHVRAAARAAELAKQAQIDPVALYREELAKWQDGQVVAEQGLAQWQAGIGAVPLQIHGWSFGNASCNLAKDAWVCTAFFKRMGLGDPSNQEFLDAKPKDWKVSWTPLNDAQVSFQLPASTRQLQDTMMRPRGQHEVSTVSDVQKIARGFTAINYSTFVPVDIPPPKGPDGNVVELPPGLSTSISTGKFTMSGPMRSIVLLSDTARDVYWSKVDLQLQDTKPSLTASRLMVSLEGTMYAKEPLAPIKE
jgi:hypothetical protein